MQKIFLILFLIILITGCPKTPNTVPFDNLRDVFFSVDMNDEIDAGSFDIENDTISINGDFTDWIPQEMTDEDSNGVYDKNFSDLILGSNYNYFFQINDIPEDIGTRIYAVIIDENIVLDVYNVLIPTTVTLKVNMNYQVDLENFDPNNDFVDVAGTFNDWAGSGAFDDADGDYIYEKFYDDFEPADSLEFKFRINANWETAEFPDGGLNRTCTVIEGENIKEYWYNDESPPE